MARVFIGIPTLNRPRLVRETVLSVMAQTRADWLAVVSDNVSAEAARDDVRQWVAGLGEPRVGFFAQPVNGGEYGQGRFFFAQALEHGCDYLVILHDDDVLRPDFVASAVAALDAAPGCAFYVCNPSIIDDAGAPQPEWSASFDRRWGREGTPGGEIDVLDTHMACGFTPISGAFFRVASLRDSGFVDPDLHGCFPFESNIFLRLGERGAKAWFDPERRFSLRWHQQQMINWGFLNDEQIVRSTITLFERRRFSGINERRRRQTLARLYRVLALHRARDREHAAAQRAAWLALKTNPASLRNLLLGGTALALPQLLGGWVRRRFGPRSYAAA